MLTILRTQSKRNTQASFFDATVVLRINGQAVEDCPDLEFVIRTYNKISKDDALKSGDNILLPINRFFETLTDKEHISLYKMYAQVAESIEKLNVHNRSEVLEKIHTVIHERFISLNLTTRLVDFCRSGVFTYPNLDHVGKEAHHTLEKTFYYDDYVEITAISLISKMMVPIWGAFIYHMDTVDINANQREPLALDFIEPTLEDPVLRRIYKKLYGKLSGLTREICVAIDKKTLGSTKTDFILTHSGIDIQIFDAMIMATIIVKKMATFECFGRGDAINPPNIIVYIDDSIKKTSENKVKALRKDMKMMPHHGLSGPGDEDNSSILEHVSKTSKKPIDTVVYVTTMAELYEIDRLIVDTDTPLDLYQQAVEYYESNPFDISPFTQSLVASFTGIRFGGARCTNLLPPPLYQRLVVIVQIWLLRNGYKDLAALLTSHTSPTPIDGGESLVAGRIRANLEGDEYLRCKIIFSGFINKVKIPFGPRKKRDAEEFERIDFVNLIDRMIEWLGRYTHTENMAPCLWDYAKVEARPIPGSELQFAETIIRDQCQVYLFCHDGAAPF